MESFQASVLATIDAHGFRISPRLTFAEQLARFVHMYSLQKGKPLSFAEAEACASLMLLRYSVQKPTSRTLLNKRVPRTRSEHRLHAFLNTIE
jgi:hypothetical protein